MLTLALLGFAASNPLQLQFPCDLAVAESVCVGRSLLVPWQRETEVTVMWSIGEDGAEVGNVDIALLESPGAAPAASCVVDSTPQAMVLRDQTCGGALGACSVSITVPSRGDGYYTLRINGTRAGTASTGGAAVAACSRPFYLRGAASLTAATPKTVELAGPTEPFVVESRWAQTGLDEVRIELVVVPVDGAVDEQTLVLATHANASALQLDWKQKSPSAVFSAIPTAVYDVFSDASYFNLTNARCVQVETSGVPACADRTQLAVEAKSDPLHILLKSTVFNVSAVDWEVGQNATLNTNVWNISQLEVTLGAHVVVEATAAAAAEGARAARGEYREFVLRSKSQIFSPSAHYLFRLPNVTLSPYAHGAVNVTTAGYNTESGTSKLVWSSVHSVALGSPTLSDPLLATRVQQGCAFDVTWNVLSERWKDDDVEVFLVGNETKTAGNFFVAGRTRVKDFFLVTDPVESTLAPGLYR